MSKFNNFQILEISNGATCLASGSSLFKDLEAESFKTFFNGLSEDPLNKIRTSFDKLKDNELLDYLNENPYMGNRTFMDLLSSVPEESLIKYPKLLTLKQEILNQLSQVNHNYKIFIQEKLNEGLTLAEAQVESVRHFLNLDKTYSKTKIEQLYFDEGVTQEEAERIVAIFELAGKLIPNKYKKNLPPLNIVVKPSNNQISFATSSEDVTVIVLTSKPSIIEQLALCLHEYSHLIEKYNPEINLKTNDFMVSRIRNLNLVSMKSTAEKYRKPYNIVHAHEEVYEGDFIDPYIGKTYGHLGDARLVLTEALSVGIEAMMLNPLNFYFRDSEHFYLIYHMLKGDY